MGEHANPYGRSAPQSHLHGANQTYSNPPPPQPPQQQQRRASSHSISPLDESSPSFPLTRLPPVGPPPPSSTYSQNNHASRDNGHSRSNVHDRVPAYPPVTLPPIQPRGGREASPYENSPHRSRSGSNPYALSAAYPSAVPPLAPSRPSQSPVEPAASVSLPPIRHHHARDDEHTPAPGGRQEHPDASDTEEVWSVHLGRHIRQSRKRTNQIEEWYASRMEKVRGPTRRHSGVAESADPPYLWLGSSAPNHHPGTPRNPKASEFQQVIAFSVRKDPIFLSRGTASKGTSHCRRGC